MEESESLCDKGEKLDLTHLNFFLVNKNKDKESEKDIVKISNINKEKLL